MAADASGFFEGADTLRHSACRRIFSSGFVWFALSENIAYDTPKIAAPAWKRNGFYLLYGGRDYEKMRTEALNRGVLLPPTAVEAAVLPLTATKGDWGKITEVLTLSEGEY